MTAAVDVLTIARSWHGRPQTKRIGRDRAGHLVKRGFANEKLYVFFEIAVLGIENLAATLGRLSADRTTCIVRGTPVQGIATPARRLAHPDPDTGNVATLAPTARRVLAVDMDGIDQGLVEDPAVDPEDAVEHLIGLLPDEFADAGCWWQFSSSQGFKPGKLSARLWFILDRPVADEDLRRWANAVNQAAGRKLVDPALYNPAQPHYIAAPVLEGIDDPLPRRSGFRRGLSDEVEIVIPEPAQIAAGGKGLGLKPARGFESYLAAIGGEHGFNNAIFRAICSYVGSHGVDGTDPAALRERLREAVLAAPPGGRSRAEIERYASARYLDAEIRRVLARKAAEQEPPAVSAPHYQADELEAAAASRLLRKLVAEFVAWNGKGDPPQRGIRAAAGLGKTRAFLEALPTDRQLEVWYFVPRARLSTELAVEARRLGQRAQVVRGREAEVDGEKMCAKADIAADVARAGLPVMTSLCSRKIKEKGKKRGEGTAREELCEHYLGCRYLRQFWAEGPAVRFFAHEYLTLAENLPKGLPPPDLIVIDESFALKMARCSAVGLDRLTAPRGGGMKIEREAEIMDVAIPVRDLLERGLDPRDAATVEAFRNAAKVEAFPGGEAAIWPSMPTATQRKRAGELAARDHFRLAALWQILGEEKEGGGALQRVQLRRSEPAANGEKIDRVRMWWRAKLHIPAAPVLLLDASLDEEIARLFFPRIEIHTIAVRRNAHVTQVLDSACSRNRLLGFLDAPEHEKTRAANRLQDVRHLAEVEAKRGSVLLVTYKAAEERLGSIPGVDIEHFGNLRGTDRYKGYDCIIVAGREQPGPRGRFDKDSRFWPGLEDDALSLFGEVSPSDPAGRLPTEVRGIRMHDGSLRGVPVEVHPDPHCQRLQEQIRECETAQALDRLRLIHRETPARVRLLSNLVVDCTVDRLVTWRELVPDRLTVAAARLDGVLPLAPAWLAARCPDLWGSEEAARQEVKRSELMGQTPNKILYLGNDPLTPAVYRLAGQRGPHPSRALIVEGHPSPKAALAALVGPLASFRWAAATTEAEGEEPAAAGPEPAPPEEPVVPPVSKPQIPDHEPEAAPAPPPAGCARCGVPVDGGTLCQVCAWLGRPPVRSPPRPSIAPSWEDDRAWLRLIGKAESREKRIEVVAAWAAAAGGTLWRQGDEATLALPATLRRGLARAELLTQTRILLFDRVQIEEYQPGHIPFAPPVTRPLIGLRRVGLPWARRS